MEVTQEVGVNENAGNPQAEGGTGTHQSGQSSQTQAAQSQTQGAQVKRKAMDTRSDVWNHFTKLIKNDLGKIAIEPTVTDL